nr:DUF6382 domain-containing protein [uncultured Anaerocolumna sp.]
MLHAEYVRDIHNNYLILKGIKDCPYGFRTKILLNNTIEGMLKVELRFIDQMDLFYYDITGKKTLAAAYENKSLQHEDIKKLLGGILKTINVSGEYLLSENDFIIDPEYIFIGNNLDKIYMCYLEGYKTNMLNQFSKLMEYLMNKIDYKDENAVVLTYGLYKESREESCTYERLMKEIEKKLPLQDEKPDVKNSVNIEKDNVYGNTISQVNNTKYNTGNLEDSKQYKDISINKNAKIYRDVIQKDEKSNKHIRTNKKTKANKNKTINMDTEANRDIKTNIGFNKNADIKESTDGNSILSFLFGNKRRQIKSFIDKNNWFNSDKKTHEEEEHRKYSQNGSCKNQGKDYPFIEEIQREKEVLIYEKKTYVMAIGAVLFGVILFVVILHLKLLYNTFGTQIDSVKLIGCLLILCSGEIYIFSKLFSNNNRITKMVTSVEYIEPNLEEVVEINSHRETYPGKQSKLDLGYERQFNRDEIMQSGLGAQVHLDMAVESELGFEKENNEGSKNNFNGGMEDTIVLWKEEENDSEKTKILADLTPKVQYYLESCDDANNTVISVSVFPFIIGKLVAGVNHKIQDPAVSRRHAKFMREKEDIYLIDLGSTNGTFLNGVRLTAHKLYKLSFNDEILIAQNKFRWKIK